MYSSFFPALRCHSKMKCLGGGKTEITIILSLFTPRLFEYLSSNLVRRRTCDKYGKKYRISLLMSCTYSNDRQRACQPKILQHFKHVVEEFEAWYTVKLNFLSIFLQIWYLFSFISNEHEFLMKTANYSARTLLACCAPRWENLGRYAEKKKTTV